MKRLKTDLLIIFGLSLFLPLFLYNLGNYSLVDFDEAWYAGIAHNILKTGNLWTLTFNGQGYAEHPPFGFWLMALSFKLFGISDFTARLPSALSGFISLIVIYLIGKNLFNRFMGIGASLTLVSSVWFIFRARSGNLDTIFLLFYLLSFYFAIKFKQSAKWLIPFSLTIAAVNLTKMLIGLSIFIPIFLYFMIEKIPIKLKHLLIFFAIQLIFILPWLIPPFVINGPLFLTHILKVGFRTAGWVTPNWLDLGGSLTFQYLHWGIRKWYYPFLIALIGNLIFIKKEKRLLPVYGLLLFMLYGFLTNSKTEIWHLIPLYPFIGLIISVFFYRLISSFWQIRAWSRNFVFLLPFAIFSMMQIYNFRSEVKLFDKDISGLAGISSNAKNYPERLYLYTDYFPPAAVFYSQKEIKLVATEKYPQNTLVGIIDNGPKPFLLIGEKWKFDLDKINPQKYKLLSEHKEYILVRVN